MIDGNCASVSLASAGPAGDHDHGSVRRAAVPDQNLEREVVAERVAPPGGAYM
jgi:hypothetical protein